MRFLETIEKYSMVNPGDRILAALSGGADSVCLLLNFLKVKEKYNIEISAVHVNHHLRGEESDSDEQFCRELCKRLGVELFVRNVDVISYAKEEKKSIEEAARDLRYKEFSSFNGMKIATAHNLNDNAETVLLNLSRGTGLKGLCGIPPVRGNIIRPLIETSRREIEDFLKQAGQGFAIDKTNLTSDYTRNKIRLEIMPKLREINPAADFCIGRAAGILQEENDFLENEANRAYERCFKDKNSLFAEKLVKEHPAIRKRCLARFLEDVGLSAAVCFEKLEKLDEILLYGGKINIAKDVYICCFKGIIYKEEKKKPLPQTEFELKIGENKFFNKIVRASLESDAEEFKNANVNKKFAIVCIDYDKIQGKAILRNRRDGDKIKLLNRNFTSSVKKLLNDRKIPPGERDGLVFLADDEGVVFIEGIGISDRVKPDGNTKRILKIEIVGSVWQLTPQNLE